MIFAIESQASDLMPHQFAKLRLHLLRQGDCPEAEDRYAETVFKKDPEEFVVGLFQLLKTVGGLCIVIIFIERLKCDAIIVH
jgi:hypothetical protein